MYPHSDLPGVTSNIVQLNATTRSLLSTLTGIVLFIASGLIALFSIILVTVLNKQTKDSDTIQTWTCRFSKALPNTMVLGGLEAVMSNDKFGIMCQESVSFSIGSRSRSTMADNCGRNLDFGQWWLCLYFRLCYLCRRWRNGLTQKDLRL
jgi:hypothetical protein